MRRLPADTAVSMGASVEIRESSIGVSALLARTLSPVEALSKSGGRVSTPIGDGSAGGSASTRHFEWIRINL